VSDFGYPIAAEAFDYEVFQLACTFAASTELLRLSKDYPGIARLCQTFELSDAARRLVSVAAMVRSALDTWSTVERDGLIRDVGRLVPNVTQPDSTVALTFREACNKILHADSMDLVSDASPVGLRYEILLAGQKGDREWRAYVDVLRFVDVASYV
jgi:hypothetical protein